MPRRSSTRRALDDEERTALAEIEATLQTNLARVDRKRDLDRARIDRRLIEAQADIARAKRLGDEGVDKAAKWSERISEAATEARVALDSMAGSARISARPSEILRRFLLTKDEAWARESLLHYGLHLPRPPSGQATTLQPLFDRFAFMVKAHEHAEEDVRLAHERALHDIRRAKNRHERILASRRERRLQIDQRAREDRKRLEDDAARLRRLLT